jgi:cysteinyl-tRNA synthetase
MAKSKGGAPRLANLTEAGFHPMAFRLFLLGGHYRSQLDFTPHAIDAAQATLRRLVARIEPLRPLPAVDTLAAARAQLTAGTSSAGTGADPAAERMLDQIDAAISNDLATPRILAVLQEALRDSSLTPHGQRVIIAAADALLGLELATLQPADIDHRRAAADLTPAERAAIEQLVADRTDARANRDWARADEIRAELDKRGVQVTDTAQGPVWQLA